MEGSGHEGAADLRHAGRAQTDGHGIKTLLHRGEAGQRATCSLSGVRKLLNLLDLAAPVRACSRG
jgi:hypothetical protein